SFPGFGLGAGLLRASDTGNCDSNSHDAPARLIRHVGLVPCVGGAHVEAAAIGVAQGTGQHKLVEIVFVGDGPVVNPKHSLVDRVGHPAAALVVEAYAVGGAEGESCRGGQ